MVEGAASLQSSAWSAVVTDPVPVGLPITWRQGEHVAIIGRNGTGKTYLISQLLTRRKYVVVLKTKRDPEDAQYWRGFHLTRRAKTIASRSYDRILLMPEYRAQAREGADLLERIWQQGSWCVVIDENWYAERLGLEPWITRLLTQGRSERITVVVGMQRPVDVSRFGISQAQHVFAFKGDGRDAETIAKAVDDRLLPIMRGLSGHDFGYYYAPRQLVATGNARTLGAVIAEPIK